MDLFEGSLRSPPTLRDCAFVIFSGTRLPFLVTLRKIVSTKLIVSCDFRILEDLSHDDIAFRKVIILINHF
jgi:hypothetical protein